MGGLEIRVQWHHQPFSGHANSWPGANSVGLEDTGDLVADVMQALEQA